MPIILQPEFHSGVFDGEWQSGTLVEYGTPMIEVLADYCRYIFLVPDTKDGFSLLRWMDAIVEEIDTMYFFDDLPKITSMRTIRPKKTISADFVFDLRPINLPMLKEAC